MRTIVHLSDLHFGRVDAGLVEPLIETVRAARPHVVVVSGDLTQRARAWQFKEARTFLDALPKPQIVVPGNHDVPLYNVFARFLTPLENYRRYVSADLEPFYRDEEIAVLGLNTARSLTFKNGRINQEQLQVIRSRFSFKEPGVTKILATHHPFDLPKGHDEDDLVGRARTAMERLAACRIDILLAGHLHVSHSGHTADRYRIAGYSALVVSAGTALSERRRGEQNSFNLLRIDWPRATVSRCVWNPDQNRFVEAQSEIFAHGAEGWRQVAEPPKTEAS
jgi:3',5'-cyclic AMP phosphodiesterase CpdA